MHHFHLDEDWSPTAPTTRDEQFELRDLSEDLHLVGRCGSEEDGDEWAVLYDQSARWGLPGRDDLVALHLTRNRARKTFTIEGQTFPTVGCAEGWLVTQGANPDAFDRTPGLPEPADEITRVIEARVRRDFPHLERSYSHVDDNADAARVVLKDTAATDPRRVYLGHVEYAVRAGRYAIREQGFATREEARQWVDDYEPPELENEDDGPDHLDRTGAALAQSGLAQADPTTTPSAQLPSAPVSTPTPRSR